MRSRALKEILQQNNSKIIEITGYSYDVYYAYLKYLYSNSIDQVSEEVAFELLKLAEAYLEEDLKTLCANIIKGTITIENAATLLSYAIDCNAEGLHDFCSKFILENINEVIKTDSFKTLNSNAAKQFVMKLAHSGKLNP